VSYLKTGREMFVVIDAIKVLRPDYYTFTNLWHTRKITTQSKFLNQAPVFFNTMYDKIQTDELPLDKDLTIYFPENAQGKQIGTFPVTRHFQDETAIYQTVSQFYQAGDFEFFVTILFPRNPNGDLSQSGIHSRNFTRGDVLLPGAHLLEV